MEVSGFAVTGVKAPVAGSTFQRRAKSGGARKSERESKEEYYREEKDAGTPERDAPKPTGLARAKHWSDAVEENFRLQRVGWRDIYEYESVHGEPKRWPSGYISCLRTKQTGYYTYWQNERECMDKDVPKVKLYRYTSKKK